jgi:hypothetical protein
MEGLKLTPEERRKRENNASGKMVRIKLVNLIYRENFCSRDGLCWAQPVTIAMCH